MPLTRERLGVVVLAYGESDQHRDLLADLEAAGMPGRQVVVSHNPDRPAGSPPSSPPGGTVLSHPYNLGYAAAMNAGIALCRGRGDAAVLLLTHDVRLGPGTLDELLRSAHAAPGHGVLGLTVAGAGGAERSYGAYMGSDGLVAHVTHRPSGDGVADMPWVDGCALLLRTAALEAEPLPERYFLYFEEAELCDSMRARGWRVGTALDAVASSVSGIRSRRGAFLYLYTRNGLDWTRRWRGQRAAAGFIAWELLRAVAGFPRPWRRRFVDGSAWRGAGVACGARLLGVLDALRGRWGPPPPWLLRTSDVRNVAPIGDDAPVG